MDSSKYFKYLNIPGLEQITLELQQYVHSTEHIKRNGRPGFTFCSMVPGEIIEAAPTLHLLLAEFGVAKHVERIGLPIVGPNAQGILHVDAASSQSLNMPVWNCEKSYTEWWDGVDLDIQRDDVRVADGAPTAPYYKCLYNENSKPVTRAHLMQPLWYNTSLPHRGINEDDEPRVIITLRFSVDIKPILDAYAV